MNVPPGVSISQAADLALGAARLFLAALVRLEDAEEQLSDFGFLDEAGLAVVNTSQVLDDLMTVASDLLRTVDAYGRAQVGRG
jgi:hypothetical protein